MLISLLFVIPFVTGLLCLIPKRIHFIGRIQAVGMLTLFIAGLAVVKNITQADSLYGLGSVFYLDSLSGLMILILIFVSLVSSLYSIGYMVNEAEEKISNIWKLKGYYFLLNIFILTMLLVITTNNLGLMWIGIEATTLVSAFLVGYYNRENPIEAAWKYLILCTVGIAFAMIGIILAYYAVTHAGGIRSQGLDWDYLIRIGHRLNPTLMKISFIFILIGYGTKAGLAPMHTWLPDAYSEAPAPVSALLSGVLSKCVLYVIIRFVILTNIAVGSIFTSKLLMFFGLFSLVVAALFILIQKNIKRLLAYSSLEHIGIIAIGLSFGSPMALFGTLFHMINHAAIKSLMFFTSGNVALKFRTKNMEHIKGVIQLMPVSGIVLLIAGLALAGVPPFSIFVSEFYILWGGIQANYWWQSLVVISLLVIIFGGFAKHLIDMSLGEVPEEASKVLVRGEVNRSGILAIIFPLIVVCLFGVWLPAPLTQLLNEAVKIISLGKGI